MCDWHSKIHDGMLFGGADGSWVVGKIGAPILIKIIAGLAAFG